MKNNCKPRFYAFLQHKISRSATSMESRSHVKSTSEIVQVCKIKSDVVQSKRLDTFTCSGHRFFLVVKKNNLQNKNTMVIEDIVKVIKYKNLVYED